MPMGQPMEPIDPLVAQFRAMQMDPAGHLRGVRMAPQPATTGYERGPQGMPFVDVNPRTQGPGVAGPPRTSQPKQPSIVPTTYQGWTFVKSKPEHRGEKSTWRLVDRTQMPLSSEVLEAGVKRRKAKNRDTLMKDLKLLSSNQRNQIDRLVEEKMRAETNPDVEWTLAGLDLETQKINPFMAPTELTRFDAIIKRAMKPAVTDARKSHASGRSGNVVDLDTPLPRANGSQSSGQAQGQNVVRNQQMNPPQGMAMPPHFNQAPRQTNGAPPQAPQFHPQGQNMGMMDGQGMGMPQQMPQMFPGQMPYMGPGPQGQPGFAPHQAARPTVIQHAQPRDMPQQGRPVSFAGPHQAHVTVLNDAQGGPMYDDEVMFEYTEPKKKKKAAKKAAEVMDDEMPQPAKKKAAKKTPIQDADLPPRPPMGPHAADLHPRSHQHQHPINIHRKSSLKSVGAAAKARVRKAQDKVEAWQESSSETDFSGLHDSSNFSDTGNSTFTPPSSPRSDFAPPLHHRRSSMKAPTPPKPFPGSLYNRPSEDPHERARVEGAYREHRKPPAYHPPADIYVGDSRHHRRPSVHSPQFSPHISRSASVRDPGYGSRYREHERERERPLLQHAATYHNGGNDYMSSSRYRDGADLGVRHIRGLPAPMDSRDEFRRATERDVEKEREREREWERGLEREREIKYRAYKHQKQAQWDAEYLAAEQRARRRSGMGGFWP